MIGLVGDRDSNPMPCCECVRQCLAKLAIWSALLGAVVAWDAWRGNVVAVWQGTYMKLGVSASY